MSKAPLKTSRRARPFDAEVLRYANTDDQRRVYSVYGEAGSINETARRLGKDVGQVSKQIRTVEYLAESEGWIAGGSSKKPLIDEKVVNKNVKKINNSLKKVVSTYIITWAQNATDVHKGFWGALKKYAEFNHAVIIVIPGRYRNPTSIWTQNNDTDEWWTSEVTPHIMNARQDLNENFVVMGDIKIQPTATKPLSGLDAITGRKSGVFGHPKVQLKSVATPQQDLPKLQTTTGSVTVDNYTDSKSGKKGEFHHSLGATVVEIEGDKFFARQLNATDSGSFIDLEYEYTEKAVTKAGRPLGLVLGDIHTEFMDPLCEEAIFHGKSSICNVLDPEKIILHDLYDGYSGSHHHKGEIFTNYAKHLSGRDSVNNEVDRTFEKIKTWLREGTEFYVVDSNHNDHLLVWLKKCDPKLDPVNALFYHRLSAMVYEKVEMLDSGAYTPNPLQLLAENRGLECLKFLNKGDTLMIAGISCEHHGHKGTNGARGSILSFTSIGVKTVTGHGHAPGIEGGAYRTGTNSYLDLEYVGGLSSWLHTDCLINANGKRTLIHKLGSEWRASRRARL